MLLDIMIKLSKEDGQFEDPGWMHELFADLIKRDQVLFLLESKEPVAFVGYWLYGKNRIKFIKNIRNEKKCPKQLAIGKRMYIPVLVVRNEYQGQISLTKFFDKLKLKEPTAKWISWHDNFGKFREYKLIREAKNVNIQKEEST